MRRFLLLLAICYLNPAVLTAAPLRGTFETDDGRAEREEYRAYLVPLRPGELPGANGSLWRTDLVVHNSGRRDTLLLLNNCDEPFRTPPCTNTPVPVLSRETRALQLEPGLARFEGTFLYVPKGVAERIDLAMRVRDVSRDAEGFGTQVPIVPLDEFDYSIRLLDVPTDPRFRVLLRIYGDRDTERFVHVRVYPMSGNTLIEERFERVARGQGIMHDPAFPFVAAYTRFDPITGVVRASGHDRVRIEIDAEFVLRADPPLLLPHWAFVSITNNVTQQVTTVTPHR